MVNMNNLTNFEKIALSDCKVKSSDYFKEVFDSIIYASYFVGIPIYILSALTGFLIFNFSLTKKSKYPGIFIGLLCLAQAIQVNFSMQYTNDYCEIWHNQLI